MKRGFVVALLLLLGAAPAYAQFFMHRLGGAMPSSAFQARPFGGYPMYQRAYPGAGMPYARPGGAYYGRPGFAQPNVAKPGVGRAVGAVPAPFKHPHQHYNRGANGVGAGQGSMQSSDNGISPSMSGGTGMVGEGPGGGAQRSTYPQPNYGPTLGSRRSESDSWNGNSWGSAASKKLACVANGVYCGMRSGHEGDKCSCKKGKGTVQQGLLKN